METLFHLSLPCKSVEKTKDFYNKSIGASIGRYSENWVDINLFGHQITFTQAGKFSFNSPNYIFEKKILPSFHYGIILDSETWENVYKKLNNLNLITENKVVFLQNKSGEHESYFVKDPNGYMIEFKCFKNSKSTFEK